MNIRRSFKIHLSLALLSCCFLCFGDAFLKVPLCRQGTDYTCGVAAMQCILAYYEEDPPRQDVIAKIAKSGAAKGTSYKNLEKLAQDRGYEVMTYKNEGKDIAINRLKGFLEDGKPVIVLIQAWDPTVTAPSQYENRTEDGHYVVAIGYDSENMYFMDPSTLGNYTYIPTQEFTDYRWHENDKVRKTEDKLLHFMMVMTKGQPVFNPREIRDLK